MINQACTLAVRAALLFSCLLQCNLSNSQKMYRQKYQIYPFALILIPAMYFSVILMSITFASTTNTYSLLLSQCTHRYIHTYTSSTPIESGYCIPYQSYSSFFLSQGTLPRSQRPNQSIVNRVSVSKILLLPRYWLIGRLVAEKKL